MKDWIKHALTRRIRKRTKTTEIPPDPRLVLLTKLTITSTLTLTALEIIHITLLHTWNHEIFAAITGLTGTITGILTTSQIHQ